MTDDRFDALVIGGGPAGSTAALLLARAGWSVALLERSTFPRRKVCGEYLSATNWPLLESLGVAEACREAAGPSVRRVGLFAGNSMLSADLPRGDSNAWGISLGRESLDTLLLREASKAGVSIHQPATATRLTRSGNGYSCSIRSDHEQLLHARVIVAAHGSWLPGTLPTQPPRPPVRRGDLLGFKATYSNAKLADDLMPLLTFRGGYGGMVIGHDQQLSVSCCIRRDLLQQLRTRSSNDAGELVESYLVDSCRGAREALRGASRLGPWLAAGPIRPGVRCLARDGIFSVGNAAGEAHPVVAEGISMALQGAWILAGILLRNRAQSFRAIRTSCEIEFTRAWRRAFLPRLRTAALIAKWAQSPSLVSLSLPLLHLWPHLLTWCARLSGKDRLVVPPIQGSLLLAEAT